MKTVLFLALALTILPTAHAAELTFSCLGTSPVLGNLEKIEWNRDGVVLTGLKDGKSYALSAPAGKVYSGNGYSYSTELGEVIIPFGLVNGRDKDSVIQLSNAENPNESQLCSRD